MEEISHEVAQYAAPLFSGCAGPFLGHSFLLRLSIFYSPRELRAGRGVHPALYVTHGAVRLRVASCAIPLRDGDIGPPLRRDYGRYSHHWPSLERGVRKNDYLFGRRRGQTPGRFEAQDYMASQV